jgi:hypothetical protein
MRNEMIELKGRIREVVESSCKYQNFSQLEASIFSQSPQFRLRPSEMGPKAWRVDACVTDDRNSLFRASEERRVQHECQPSVLHSPLLV